MKTFSIAELERCSLIKAHTYRSWEQRFPIFESKRTETNIRYYTIDELDFLLDFSLLNRFGVKVSKLVNTNKESLKKMVLNLNTEEAKKEHQINSLIISMFSFEHENFEFILDNSIISWGIDETVEEIIIPFLERIDLFSFKEKKSGEYHMAITILRKKLMLAIEQTISKNIVPQSTLLFLPEGQHYDLVLLYLYYKIKKLGYSVLYLGTDICASSLLDIIERKQPDYIITFVSKDEKNILDNLSTTFTKENLPPCLIASSGYCQNLDLPDRKLKILYYKELANIISIF